MNKLIASSACAVLLLTPVLAPLAHAQSVGEKTGVNSTLGIAPTTQDFVTEAANSDILEIAAAKLAEQKGNAEEKKFAGQMVTDHTQTSKDIKGLVDSGDVKATIPVKLDDSSQKKLDELRNSKPEDFPGYYDPMQVSAHKKRGVAVRALCQVRRQSEAEGLGRKDAADVATSPANGGIAQETRLKRLSIRNKEQGPCRSRPLPFTVAIFAPRSRPYATCRHPGAAR